MTEENYRKWDTIIKIVAPVLTVAGLLIGLWQFTRDQAAQLERQYKLLAANDRLDFKRHLWEKQLEVYMNISNVVGKLVGENQSKAEFSKTIDQFYTLYWGNMIYVEDEEVEKAMIDFHLEVQDYLKGVSAKDRLKMRANQLIETCRKSSKKQWFAQEEAAK